MTRRPSDDPQGPAPEPAESDERFPSGPWSGYYQQHGRHGMDLTLTFRKGQISGDGRDSVGTFLIRGSYDTQTGKCHWSKRYLGAHDVHYDGYNEGKGIWGVWDLRGWGRGGFHIWPKAWGQGIGLSLEEEIEEPGPGVTVEVGVEDEMVVGVS